MTYLYWYLGIGAVVIALQVAVHKLTEKKNDNALSPTFTDLGTASKSPVARLVSGALTVILAGVLIVPFWPLIALLRMYELVFGKPAHGSTSEPEFAVTRKDLQTELSIVEIEQQEMVFDPLGAAPNVPFGHLNKAWMQFCENMGPADSLWNFSAIWTYSWGGMEVLQGYVLVHGGEIGRHFITVVKKIEKDAEPLKFGGERSVACDIPDWLRRQSD